VLPEPPLDPLPEPPLDPLEPSSDPPPEVPEPPEEPPLVEPPWSSVPDVGAAVEPLRSRCLRRWCSVSVDRGTVVSGCTVAPNWGVTPPGVSPIAWSEA
jgi:hypothetical protein